MKKTQWITALFCCAFASGANAAFIDAQIVHVYDLDGNTTDSLGGPDITTNSGGLQSGGGLTFDANGGPSIVGGVGQNLFGGGPVVDYSIEFSFQFDSSTYSKEPHTFTDPFGGPDLITNIYPYVKVLDFDNQNTDPGLYINNEGFFEFRAHGVQGFVEILPDIEYHIVFARSNDLGVQLYVDGQEQFRGPGRGAGPQYSDDTVGQARIELDALHFFLDDNETTDPNASGSLNFANLYTGTLTPDQVAGLIAGGTPPGLPPSIPVPGALLLVMAGLPLMRRRGLKTI